MKQILLKDFGISNLELVATDKPTPKPGEILVRMQAASLNYVDLAIVEGMLGRALPLPLLPVADGAGVIDAVGDTVRGFAPGDMVATVYIPPWRGGRYTSDLTGLSIRPGAGTVPGQLSEWKCFKPDEVIVAPAYLSPAEAATLPIAGVTAWNALRYGQIRPGQTVLIHGTGGVSIFALQLTKLFGANAIITSSSDEKLALARTLGADHIINYRSTPRVADEVLAATDGEGVALVIETVGGGNLRESLTALAPEGHISIVGFLAGMSADLDLVALNLKRASLTGVSVGSRADFAELLTALAQHALHPAIGATFPLERVQDAFHHLKSGAHFGKIVLTL